jgi:FMN phosphatase YigB (HAD superfamily)
MNTKAVLFDFGNVLGTFRHMTACEWLAKHCSHTPETIHHHLFGTYTSLRQTGITRPNNFFEIVRDLYRLDPSVTYEVFAEHWGDIFTPAPDLIRGALDLLRPELIAAIATNTEELHWAKIADLETVQRFINEPNRYIVKSYEVGYEKPDECFFVAALDMIGVSDPGHVLFIDDVEENVRVFERMGGHGKIFNLTVDDPSLLGYILDDYGLLI